MNEKRNVYNGRINLLRLRRDAFLDLKWYDPSPSPFPPSPIPFLTKQSPPSTPSQALSSLSWYKCSLQRLPDLLSLFISMYYSFPIQQAPANTR